MDYQSPVRVARLSSLPAFHGTRRTSKEPILIDVRPAPVVSGSRQRTRPQPRLFSNPPPHQPRLITTSRAKSQQPTSQTLFQPVIQTVPQPISPPISQPMPQPAPKQNPPPASQPATHPIQQLARNQPTPRSTPQPASQTPTPSEISPYVERKIEGIELELKRINKLLGCLLHQSRASPVVDQVAQQKRLSGMMHRAAQQHQRLQQHQQQKQLSDPTINPVIHHQPPSYMTDLTAEDECLAEISIDSRDYMQRHNLY